ncbi:hypothetical protein PMAYCL1PPCAC_16853, partial [Pristionchus mayeri]
MNTTELSSEFQYAVSLAHLISGPVFFAFNAFVCLLILLDSDDRGKVYRKYLFALQFFSTLADAWLSTHSPIMQFNCRLMYNQSEIMIYFTLFFGVGYTYFVCVYYRRNTLLPQDEYFCFHGWKYSCFLSTLLLFYLIVLLAVYCIVAS